MFGLLLRKTKSFDSLVSYCYAMGKKRKPTSTRAVRESSLSSEGSDSDKKNGKTCKKKVEDQEEKVLKKRRLQEDKIEEPNSYHLFTESEDVRRFRLNLLQWYDENKRDLPWRKWASHPNPNQRAYGVWVSEIMLQQTQVATVIDYYNRWMMKWPTLEDLAISATLEEVNEMWSGLGYYSRGRRLFEGAKKVVETLGGVMPNDAESLMKQLSGVGRYTAGAIASIAFQEKTGVVDGNVIRVLARARAIGADSTSAVVQSTIWSLANTLVDAKRPGDFNQAMMELGATICTPKAPSCDKCPIKKLCRAYHHKDRVQSYYEEKHKEEFSSFRVKQEDIVPDIECAADNCQLCIPASEGYDEELGVLNYPRKPKKKPPRQEQTAVCIVEKKSNGKKEPDYLLVQRPETGLLAGLWEFPSATMDSDCWPTPRREKAINGLLRDKLKMKISAEKERHSVGEVVHIFSHIEQTYCVETFTAYDQDIKETTPMAGSPSNKWFTAQDFWSGAVSTAMKKCFSAYLKSISPPKVNSKKMKFDSKKTGDAKKQTGLDSFFKPVQKK
ncbi:adenine DNA glycosylase-like isoform X1 [Asterias rubens]|uniref:adenine DNA glycosylase-like isoform X1 n=2 Tax=Asterias rubens TaxID=7604 RepID=UPI001455B0D0|nr:adenine DNA glycosylase-like isoform X1 [Asterias rubens]